MKSSSTLGKAGEGLARRMGKKDTGVDMRGGNAVEEKDGEDKKAKVNEKGKSLYDEHGFLKSSPSRR